MVCVAKYTVTIPSWDHQKSVKPLGVHHDDLNPQLEQLAMNPRSTPARVIPAHDPNEVSHFRRHGWSPRFPAPDLPPPKEAKALPMPGNHCCWLHDQQGGLPVAPHTPQPDPEDSIGGRQFQALRR